MNLLNQLKGAFNMASPPPGYKVNRYPHRLTANKARFLSAERKDNIVDYILTLIEQQAHRGYNQLYYFYALTTNETKELADLGYFVQWSDVGVTISW